MSENSFCADYAKRGTAACKKCRQTLEKGSLRLGKIVPNPFTDSGGSMKQWFHAKCLFDSFVRARATTKKIETPDDIEGWEDVQAADRELIMGFIKESGGSTSTKPTKTTPVKSPAKKSFTKATASTSETVAVSPDTVIKKPASNSKDDTFREFRRLCASVAEEPKYTAKTALIRDFLTKGRDGVFTGTLQLWVKLLLPGVVKRVYNLQSKQLIKLFSQIFECDQEAMLDDLEQGDVAATIQQFFEQSNVVSPTKKSTLTLDEVDAYLDELTQMTKEDEQQRLLKKIVTRSTGNDLKMVVRLIKGDLRINAGAKHILEAVHPDAYQAFQASRNIDAVLEQILEQKSQSGSSGTSTLKVKISLMTPVLPMLAEACRSVDQAMKKCPHGMYSEIKYDGERVQVHKQGSEFRYFSRSLKPVQPHKVSHFKEYIPKAFPNARDLILDSEVLLIDTNTQEPLPFGSLGVHKKTAFKDATVCLFVFDCLYYNGDDLSSKPIQERRRILSEVMTEIPNHIMFSEMKLITKPQELSGMISDVLKKGLEGLVLKDVRSVYEPGKRHWLKVKKDYLNEGSMADSADLVVLGAWYGTGMKGGMMSVFLMGCCDPAKDKWCTVTKVHTGHDDKTLDNLQKELQPLMSKISRDSANIPHWLNCNKSFIPDFVAKDPKAMPVWEITGAEFTKNQIHTADGISVRFPRVTKIRDDKTWQEATNLAELNTLFKKSKEFEGFEDAGSSSSTFSSPKKKTTSNVMDKFLTKTENTKRTASPSKEEKVKKIKTDVTPRWTRSKALLDIFTGVKLHIPPSIANYDELRRYFIAYDGISLDASETALATHVIHQKEQDQRPRGKPLVRIDWLWDSIVKKTLLDFNKYIVKA